MRAHPALLLTFACVGKEFDITKDSCLLWHHSVEGAVVWCMECSWR